MLKKTISLLLSSAFAAAILISGCANENKESGNVNNSTDSANNITANKPTQLSNNNIKTQTADTGSKTCTVDINGDAVITGSGALYNGRVLSITESGEYRLSGEITNGYVYIESEGDVKLILDNFKVYNSEGSAIYCYKAKNLFIELAENSENSFADSSLYTFTGSNESSEENEPNAAIYSKSDLMISGSGTLNVEGNYQLGIRCNDDLSINGGNITVSAVTNGIRGSDSVIISGGNIKINAGKDGIKSTNGDEEGRGYILIGGGNVDITAGEDGIQAETDLSVTGGTLNITTTGEVESGGSDSFWGNRQRAGANTVSSADSSASEATSKGIKCSGNMLIGGGQITVNSTDHCVHSSGEISVTGGELTLSSSVGKGISSHGDLEIDAGTINVLQSTEGIESKALFTVNGGEITIEASDDGLNSGGGSDSMFFGVSDSSDESHDMFINGGYIYVNAAGDGIDSNGNITVNGGTIIVNGPVSGGDGALDSGDFGNKITVNGGTLIAVGSLQMAEIPDGESTQNCLAAQISLNAGETVAVQDSVGNTVCAFTTKKQVQHMIFSSPKIKTGETYTIYTNVNAEGESKGGLYEDSVTVTDLNNAVCSLTVESAVTSNSSNFGGFGGNGGGFHGNGGFPGGGFGGSGNTPNNNGTPPDGFTPHNNLGTPPDNLGTPPDDLGTPPDDLGTPPDNLGTPPDVFARTNA